VTTILEVADITVRFGGVVANDHVALACGDGEVTALLGPNGAGKSTLFDVITGARRPAEGRVSFLGKDITALSPQRRARLGIARTFQNLALARDLSVYDNVLLGAARFRAYGPMAAMLRLPRVGHDDRRLRRVAGQMLELLGLAGMAEVTAGELPYGLLRRLEIARALALGPRFLMMDEPAAGMDRDESAELARALLAVRDRWGIPILVVEHDLEFVTLVADRAHVLDFGRVIASGPVAEVMEDPVVRQAYLGTFEHA
jgi:branched-chain amino acid transport system ATP-binding protein